MRDILSSLRLIVLSFDAVLKALTRAVMDIAGHDARTVDGRQTGT